MFIHKVIRNDTVYKLANRYNVPEEKIIDINQLKDASKLTIGQTLIIPAEYITYVIKNGENLYRIARRYNISVSQILAVNPDIKNPGRIYPGQKIIVPKNNEVLKNIYVNGYAFPSINMNTLKMSLSYLSFLSVFSYEVRENGLLVPINDENIIRMARAENTLPFMVITNIGESGGFNSELVSLILNSEEVQDTLLGNIEYLLKSKGYSGINIDFEYIYPSDKENYNNFLRKVVERFKPQGYTISTALAPKISDNQQGLLYEAHDYAFHGTLADFVVLMTYEWGYSRGEPQAVAPINRVEQVLKYAVTRIPPLKILMGMPNYGYDWTLPYRQGTVARSLSNIAAVNLAIDVGAEIKYDSKAQAPYFNYYDKNGKLHIVWFDDARSIEARLRLVNKYDLGGVSFWTITNYFRTNFEVLSSLYGIKK